MWTVNRVFDRSRIVGVALLLLGATVPAAFAQEAPIRIAVVDLERVVAQSAPGQALQSRLNEFTQQAQAQVEAKQAEARAVRQSMVDGANSLSAARLEELQKQLEDLTIAIQRLQDDKQREGQKLQNEGLRDIERRIQPVLAQIRDERGLDLILGWVPGVVVMAGDRVDITQAVIDRLAGDS